MVSCGASCSNTANTTSILIREVTDNALKLLVVCIKIKLFTYALLSKRSRLLTAKGFLI